MTELLHTERPKDSEPFRAAYRDGISAYAASLGQKALAERAAYLDPEKMTADREKYRKDLISLFGEPLTGYREEIGHYSLIHLSEETDFSLFRVTTEPLPGIPMTGLLYLPRRKGKMPLVLALHGLNGTPEWIGDLVRPNEYSHFVLRVLSYGCAVYCPQTLMWDTRVFGAKCDRNETDARLRMVGQSLNALELFCLRRSIDTFSAEKGIDAKKIRVAGLSYGAYLALHLAAIDQRIEAVYASCFFNDRFRYPRLEMTYPGLYSRFGDAEIGALVCPRRLWIECGRHDCFFSAESAEKEAEKLKEYYSAAGCPDAFRFSVHDGGHKFSETDTGLDFFLEGKD